MTTNNFRWASTFLSSGGFGPALPWLGGLALAFCFASTVKADCAAPDGTLLWTFPEDGQVDAPTDTLLWVRVAGVQQGTLVVRVDGVVVDAVAGLPAFQVTLAPDTFYTVDVAGTGQTGNLLAETFTFTTGTSPVDTDLVDPVVSEILTTSNTDHFADAACETEFFADTCYDGGENTY